MLLAALPLRAQISVSAATAAQSRSGRGSAPSLHTADPGADTAAPPTTLEAALRGMFASADIVFTGEVLSLDRETGAVVVQWQVQDAIRGVDAGTVYRLREWPGLWEGNSARYVVGQRALVMLYAPSVAGYGSPVNGADGIVPLRGDSAGSVLDLRLLAQRIVVTDVARLRPAEALRIAGGSLAASDALQARAAALSTNAAAAWQRALPPWSVVNNGGADVGTASSGQPIGSTVEANSNVDGAVVLGMLHAWQRDRAAAR